MYTSDWYVLFAFYIAGLIICAVVMGILSWKFPTNEAANLLPELAIVFLLFAGSSVMLELPLTLVAKGVGYFSSWGCGAIFGFRIAVKLFLTLKRK